jgi:flagellar FliL protein
VKSKLKLKFIVPLLVLLALGGVYRFVLSQPEAEAKPKVEGEVYVLPKEFLVNLADERFAKMNIALVLHGHEQLAETGGHGGGATPPEGFGPLPRRRSSATSSPTS